MNSLQSKRIHIHGSSVTVAAALLAGVLAAAPAAAQSTVPAAAGADPASQDATTRMAAGTNDPFNTFVYDVLGATPSIQLPNFLRQGPRVTTRNSDAVSSTEQTGTNKEAKPATESVGRTETAARQ